MGIEVEIHNFVKDCLKEHRANFGMRKHRGGLKESLKTAIPIRYEDFQREIVIGNYEFYAFDPRCNQLLFIAKDLKCTYTWLFVEFY